MKQTSILFISLIACITFASCGNSVTDEAETSGISAGETTKTVSFNLSDEGGKIVLNPATRAFNTEGKRYYAINILELNDKEYSKYAYGLFDGSSPISAVMKEGHKYRIDVLEFRNDKDTLYHDGNKFYEPMLTNGTNATPLENTFIYDKNANLTGIYTGKTKVGVEKSDTTWYPRAYKYYTSIDNFDPSTSDKLDITVKRAFFGIHYVITPPKYGSVAIRLLRNHYINISSKDPVYDEEIFYSFNKLPLASVEGYNATMDIFAVWTDDDGNVIANEKGGIKLKRNALSEFKIYFTGPKDLGFDIKEETTPLDSLYQDWTVKAQ